ncbi:MAG: hypothetical protein WAL32_18035, partial [Terriglobales bacterium]
MFGLKKFLVPLLVSVSCLSFGQQMQEGRLLRFPDIHKDQLVFTYGGDLWLASRSGGVARRLTTNPGREL